MEVERLLKVRNYVAWTGKECENSEQLIYWKYVQRDSIGQGDGLHVFEDELTEIIDTKIQAFGCVDGSAIY